MDMSKTPDLDRREWQAVSVALRDASGCGCAATRKPGAVSRILAWATGIAPRRPLADPRLESLRAFVCASRVRRAPAQDLAPALIAHGFNERQVAAIALLAA